MRLWHVSILLLLMKLFCITLKQRADTPDGHRALAGKLAERELEEEEGDAGQEHVQAVRNQKGACNKEKC